MLGQGRLLRHLGRGPAAVGRSGRPGGAEPGAGLADRSGIFCPLLVALRPCTCWRATRQEGPGSRPRLLPSSERTWKSSPVTGVAHLPQTPDSQCSVPFSPPCLPLTPFPMPSLFLSTLLFSFSAEWGPLWPGLLDFSDPPAMRPELSRGPPAVSRVAISGPPAGWVSAQEDMRLSRSDAGGWSVLGRTDFWQVTLSPCPRHSPRHQSRHRVGQRSGSEPPAAAEGLPSGVGEAGCLVHKPGVPLCALPAHCPFVYPSFWVTV